MGEQRPMFRFRLPWMMSSAPPPPPPPVATQSLPRAEAPSTTSQPQTTIEPNVNPTMPARRPFRLSGIAPAQPPPPIQPIVERQSQSEPVTITSTPKILPQASPIWSPKVSTTEDPHPQAEVPPETKSQSEKSFQPASPQLSVISRPPSPRQLPSQLPSPKSGPQASSPWPVSSESRDASQPSSPVHAQVQKSSQGEAFQQPHSPPQFQSSGQKSPITSSPSLTATNVQQTKGTSTQSPPRAESPSSTFQPQTNIEPNVNPTTPVQRPFRLPGIAPAQPPPPIQPTVQRQSQSESITITSGPTFPPQAPPLWSPKTSAVVDSDPLPQPQVSLESKSQSQKISKPASPNETHSQATSQHPSPSSTLAQERDTARLPSSKSSPQPSSPWRESSKARDGSQPSSPDRHLFQKSSQAETVQQPRSPSQLDFLPPKKTSPITYSPSLTTTNAQQTERTSTRLPSPSMMSTHLKSPQPSASSDKPLSPVSAKPSVAVSRPQSLDDQSNTKTTPSATFKSPTKATVQPTDNVAKPPKRDIEMVQNTSLVAQEEPKEKPKIASQAEQKQLKNPKASSHDEKQIKTMTSQQTDDKSTVSESRKQPMTSNEDRIPFQKKLRNDISMFAHKMAFAHTDNSKDERLASVVALVGKNKGASMKIGFESAKGEGSFKIHGANKIEPVEGTEEDERNKSAKRRRPNNEIERENQITKAFINNNVQGINNSILMNSFVTGRNPGVHLALFYDPTEPIISEGDT